ncbi:hypothetical protein EV182_004670 [Spiromyces aspiralis]|uniref:Uncharacterized protein n=1 Tax=Spiromyces aspiralis TaxID=68401 RepID=A0ACC1HBN5_9FUNG|nr:hypothetical protein EV182_004670 [Spiromyces aspiralis]
MKLAKRCRKCRHIMIKPESKAQAIRFKIKLVAANYIPSITILRALSPSTPLKVAPYAAGTPFTLGLRFINPVYSELDLELSTPLTVRRGASGGGNKAGPEDSQALVEVPAPRITLAPYTELWEYGDEETTNDVVSDACTKVDKSRGIVDVRGNSVTLLFRVSPLRPAKDLVIPLLVKYSHKSMDVDIDNEGEDVGTQPTAADSVTRGSFWVYLCLGPVRSQAVGDPQ